MSTSISILLFSLFFSCENNNDTERIKYLLNSKKGDPTEIINGAYLAGESGKKEFIPLLLKNANDVRMCTDIRFKGFSVYQEKMGALEKITNLIPPVEITRKPDSVVINFIQII